MRYGFVIDNRKCIGCHACTVACKTENRVPLSVNRTWVKYVEKGEFPNTRRVFQVTRCNHCDVVTGKTNYRKLPTQAVSSRSRGPDSMTRTAPSLSETSFTPANPSGALNNMIRKRTVRRDFAPSQR